MKPVTLSPTDDAGVCRHRYAKAADGTTTHHITAGYNSDTCHVSKNCGEYGFLPAGEILCPIDEITLINLM